MMVQMFKLGHYKSFKHDFRKLKEKRQFFFPKMDRPLFMWIEQLSLNIKVGLNLYIQYVQQ